MWKSHLLELTKDYLWVTVMYPLKKILPKDSLSYFIHQTRSHSLYFKNQNFLVLAYEISVFQKHLTGPDPEDTYSLWTMELHFSTIKINFHELTVPYLRS